MADSGYRMPVRKRREQAAIVCWIGNLAGISGCNWALDCAFVAAFSLFSGLMAMTGGWHWGYGPARLRDGGGGCVHPSV